MTCSDCHGTNRIEGYDCLCCHGEVEPIYKDEAKPMRVQWTGQYPLRHVCGCSFRSDIAWPPKEVSENELTTVLLDQRQVLINEITRKTFKSRRGVPIADARSIRVEGGMARCGLGGGQKIERLHGEGELKPAYSIVTFEKQIMITGRCKKCGQGFVSVAPVERYTKTIYHHGGKADD